jgi:hypothetical protein
MFATGFAALITLRTPSAAAHRIDASSTVIPYGFGMPEIYPADGQFLPDVLSRGRKHGVMIVSDTLWAQICR